MDPQRLGKLQVNEIAVIIPTLQLSAAFITSDTIAARYVKMRYEGIFGRDSTRKTREAPPNRMAQAMKMEMILGSRSSKGTSAFSSAYFFLTIRLRVRNVEA